MGTAGRGSTTSLDRETFRRQLLLLDPVEFEHFVAELCDRLRDGTTRVTKASDDMGVDVEFAGDYEKEVIQVKRYRPDNPVQRPEVQQYYALYDQELADRVTIVTASRFTDPAKEYAAEYGVTLFDGDDLYDLIRDAGLADEVSEWFGGGSYEFVDTGRDLLGRLVSALVYWPLAIALAFRPVWATVLAVALAGLAAVSASLAAPPVGSTPLEGVIDGLLATTPEPVASALVAVGVVALVGFPASLILSWELRPFKWFGGLFVAFAVVSGVFPPGTLVGGGLLVAILAIATAIPVYDVWTVHRDPGIRTWVRRGIGEMLSDDAEEAESSHDVALARYATVEATKGPGSTSPGQY